jgi:hypothetical protein
MINIMNLIGILAVTLATAWTGPAWGAISAEEAAQLGTTLTGMGAEKGGNKEGSIPPYTGGITAPPKEYQPHSGVRPNPFAQEKPLFSIDARNMESYADKLTEGVKALMKKYPTFRIDIYPTHRSVAFPDWVLAGTKKVAARATVIEDGQGVQDAQGGTGFPIPKSGHEAIWNSFMIYTSNPILEGESYYMDAKGRLVLADKSITAWDRSLHWDPKFSGSNDYYFATARWISTGPPRRTGIGLLAKHPINWAKKEGLA